MIPLSNMLKILVVVIIYSLSGTGANLLSAQESQKSLSSPESVAPNTHMETQRFSVAGKNKYMPLDPGYQLVLQGQSDIIEILVLNETLEINGITTRVVTESEWNNGNLVEISRNYYAIDKETSDIFYFGEDVVHYQLGMIIGYRGSWRAYEGDNQPGIIMPGSPRVNTSYFQENAPGVALDRAEILSLSQTINTATEEFKFCLKVRESSPLEPSVQDIKFYAPGVGLIREKHLQLVQYGLLKKIPTTENPPISSEKNSQKPAGLHPLISPQPIDNKYL